MEGIVKWYNFKKGYGFITGEDENEYFVHHTALEGVKFIRENDKVSFEAADTEKGKQAQKVVLLQKGSESAEGKAEEAPEAEEAPAEEAPAEEPEAEEKKEE